MKLIKPSNSFFLLLGLFSLVLSLGTGCGGSGGGGGGPPSNPESQPPGEGSIDDETLPDQPAPRT